MYTLRYARNVVSKFFKFYVHFLLTAKALMRSRIAFMFIRVPPAVELAECARCALVPTPLTAVPAGTLLAPPAGAEASRTLAVPRALTSPRAVSGTRGELFVILDVLAGGREGNERRRGNSRAEIGTIGGFPVVCMPKEVVGGLL